MMGTNKEPSDTELLRNLLKGDAVVWSIIEAENERLYHQLKLRQLDFNKPEKPQGPVLRNINDADPSYYPPHELERGL